jgi:flagellar basal body-associated protein FliL
MADKPTESPAAEKDAAPAETPAEPVASKSSGGLKAWLPLIVTVATMPALAFAMTAFVLAPKLQRAIVNTPAESAVETSEAAPEKSKGGTESSENKAKGANTGSTKGSKQAKVTVPLGKVLVNISGSMGTRYLMANLTLVGSSADFKEKVESNKDQLLDVASGTLGAKTISDLEKQGARNILRSELLLAFNGAVGDGIVRDIYITEFAIQ